MRYLGGKSRISKQISEVINNVIHGREISYLNSDCTSYQPHLELGGQTFVSLFCGSCAVEAKVKAETKILNDKHPYLIEMWKGLQSGWTPPSIITKEEYYYVKEHKDENKALAGFVGFGCSFGGKWFGGLASNKRGDNYCARAERSLLRDLQGVQNANFTCLDYREVDIPDGAVVYCDPPYAKTTGYTVGDFNHEEFWEYMRELSKRCIVFISEQEAPDDFEVVWEKELRRTLDYNKNNQPKKTEKLFRWKGED